MFDVESSAFDVFYSTNKSAPPRRAALNDFQLDEPAPLLTGNSHAPNGERSSATTNEPPPQGAALSPGLAELAPPKISFNVGAASVTRSSRQSLFLFLITRRFFSNYRCTLGAPLYWIREFPLGVPVGLRIDKARFA